MLKLRNKAIWVLEYQTHPSLLNQKANHMCKEKLKTHSHPAQASNTLPTHPHPKQRDSSTRAHTPLHSLQAFVTFLWLRALILKESF